MDQQGHRIDQKGLKMNEKRQKIEFLDLKRPLFSGIFLSGIGGYPPPPLYGKSSCPKSLSGNGGYPHPPLNGKNPLSSFWQLPLQKSTSVLILLLYWKTFLEQENCLNIKFDSIQLALHTSGVNQKDGCTFMVHCTDWKAAAWQRTDGCPPGPLNRTNPCSYFVGNFLYKSISFIETRLVRGKVCHLAHIQKKKSISYRRRITLIRSTD